MVLAADLSGTLLGGTTLHKQQLYEFASNNGITLVFVTGRGLATIVPLLTNPLIPIPDYIISDAGATIVGGYSFNPIEPLQRQIEIKWPGSAIVLDCFKDIKELQYLDVSQQRRCSFLLKDESMLAEIQSRADQLGCDILYSAGNYLDVLPRGVNRGSTLAKLVKHLDVRATDVLVAGCTINDLTMYQCGFKGVIVGDAEAGLVETTKNIQHVYRTEFPGAGGIIKGMEYFGFISHFAKK